MGGKSDAPDPPNYAAAARATAEGNAEAARIAAAANRVNQVTPYGNLTYSRNNDGGGFDQTAYDAAMRRYNQQLQAYNRARPASTRFGSIFGQTGPAPTAPNRNDFMTESDMDTWTATQTLSPAQQAQLEANQALNLQLTGLAQTGLNSAEGILSNPQVDFSGLPQAIGGEGAQAAIMARLQPQLDRQREMMRTQLLNQGIGMGNEAYRGAFDDQNRRENDLLSAAAIRGIDIDQQARQQGISERAYQQDRPINLINALRSGTQVQSPQWANVPQQATTAGPDLLGAATDMYGAQVGANNAQNAASAGNFQAGLGAVGTVGAAFIV